MKTSSLSKKLTELFPLVIAVMIVLLQSINGFPQSPGTANNLDLAYEWSETGNDNSVSSPDIEKNIPETIDSLNTIKPKIPWSAPAATTCSVSASVYTICSGQSVTITYTASGITQAGYSRYSSDGTNWTTFTNSEVVNYNSNVTTTYYVQIIGDIGELQCSHDTIVTINLSPTSVTAIATPNAICAGNTLTLTGTAINATSWSWTGPNGFTSALQSPTIPNITTVGTGVYTLTATNSCGSTQASTASVIVNTSIPSNVTASATPNPICSSTTLTLAGSATNATSWSWTGPNNFSSTQQNPLISNITTAGAGVYSLIATNGCGSAFSVSTDPVIVYAVPSAVTVTGGGSYCNNAVLTASNGSSGTIYFQGTTSGGTNTYLGGSLQTVTTSGSYYFRAQSVQGCWGTEGSQAVTITTSVPSQPSAIAGAINPQAGSVQTYSVTNDPATTSYIWTFPSGWSGSSTTNSINLTVGTQNGNITVTPSNSCGSGSIQTLTVSPLFGYQKTFTTSGTWTCPTGVYSVTVQCWGGGGAGGSAYANSGTNAYTQAGGGAGGSYAIKTITVVPLTVYTVTVGAAVSTNQSGDHAVANGNPSWFSSASTVYAQGGAGGQTRYNPSANAVWSGTGGTGSSALCIGTTVYSGGSGATGSTSTASYSGGGGSSAGTTANGNNASTRTGGSSPSGGGGGGSGNSSYGTAGTDGTAPGGGGGGGNAGVEAWVAGGNGAAGEVIITCTLPPCSVPTAQPVNLVFTNVAGTTLTGTFTSQTGSGAYYLVVRTTTNTPPTNPVNGTVYTTGQSALGGTIVYAGTALTWNSTGLTQGTTYYYWVYSYNYTAGTCSSSYLTGNLLENIVTTNYTIAGTEYNWICPVGVSSITVECWGGGGAGGGAITASTCSGGGGAGGGYVKTTNYAVTPGTSYPVYIGSGGTGGTGDGPTGTGSYFVSSSTIYAVGGNGGIGAATVSTSSAGGAAVSTGNLGFTSPYSYYGGAGSSSGVGGGGGGGSAGTGSNGNGYTSTWTTTGYAAVTGGGAGGNGATSSANGIAGSVPGGGGGGGHRTTSNRNGGSGAAGKVVISYTPVLCTYRAFFTVSGGGTYCSGNGLAINLSGSESDVSYQLYNGSTAVGSVVTGTGSALSWTNLTNAGTYTVVTVAIDNYCATTMTGSATIVIPPNYADQWISMSVPTTMCAGTPVNVTVIVKNIGCSPWLDGSPDVNVCADWDAGITYPYRTDALGLMAGNQQTYTFTVTPPSAGSHTLHFDVMKEGDCWFSGNTGSCGPGNSATYTSAAITVSGFPNATTVSGGGTQCFNGIFSPITVTATGNNLTYQWYSNTIAINTGGISLGANNGAQTDSYTPQATMVGTLYYYCVVIGSCGADTSDVSGAFNVSSIKMDLNLKLYLQGLYASNSQMNQAKGNSGSEFETGIADTVRLELHNPTTPHDLAYSFGNLNLNTDGSVVIHSIPCSISGSYFLVIKHRNSIETWSSTTVDFSGLGPFSYDFTTMAAKAYGSNMKLMASNVYAIYAGDATHDGLVDGSDMARINNATKEIRIGYYPEDVNGDGLVDGSDMAIIDNNSVAVVYVKRPW